jgi:uroporphyrin-III C-methyltransferase / precorrin-2 dehydrogenase / sirohydrochlorin ferrochelatase
MTTPKALPLFPAFLDLRERPVVVVGGGEIAERKVKSLLRCGARVTVVAPEVTDRLAAQARDGTLAHRVKRFDESDLHGARMVVAATDDPMVNENVGRAASDLGILVNVADDPALSTFLMGAAVERGPVQVAISTSGTSPALARRLRARIEGAVPDGFGTLAALAGRFRTEAIRRLPDPRARRRFWERVMEGPIAALALEGRETEARDALQRELNVEAEAAAKNAE